MTRKLLFLLCILALILASCGGDGDTPTATPQGAIAEDEEVSLLYVQNATSGSLVLVAGTNDTFTLTLEGISKSTVFFADRPSTVAGHVSTDLFIRNWGTGANSFAVSPPNAALDILDGEHTGDVVVVEISEPVYDEQTAQITYRAKVLKDLDGEGLLAFDERKDELENVPQSFGQVGLFIDASDALIYSLLFSNSCPDCDLSGADLSGANLTGANLNNTNLSGAFLSGTIFRGADLWRANLSGSDLTNADLTSAIMNVINLSGSDLNGADLSGSILTSVGPGDTADLSGANLTGAFLYGTDLSNGETFEEGGPGSGANLTNAVLIDANLTDAVLFNVNLTGADFTGAITTNCKGCP